MKHYKLVFSSVLFFIIFCLIDATLVFLMLPSQIAFFDALLFDVSRQSWFLRIVSTFLFLGLAVWITSAPGKKARLGRAGSEGVERTGGVNNLLEVEQGDNTSKQRLQYIFEKSPVMMHLIDGNGNFRDVNEHWLEVMGYSKEEILGRNVSFIMTPESAEASRATVLPKLWADGMVRAGFKNAM
ncbi:MAG: PAS domain S-box protein [Desulfomonilaceae bacterium]